MKKFLLILCLLIGMYLVKNNDYNVSSDSIRFRVIANSNTSRDILMKELVVKELSGLLFIKSNNINDIRKNIYDNLETIDNKISRIFKDNNYNKTYNISYGLNEFPDKVFLGNKYKSGTYESLVIEIGEAKGNNYFCIMYPSLCMIDYNEKEKDENKINFKIIEVLKDLF